MPPRLQQTVFESGKRADREIKNDLLKYRFKGIFARGKTGSKVSDIECKSEDLKKRSLKILGKGKTRKERRK